MARVFFALLPPPETARRLAAIGAALAEKINARPTPTDNLHITLAFLGEQAPERISELIALAQTLEFGAFDLELDEIACWPRPRIVWAGASKPCLALSRFAADLRDGLKRLNFDTDERDYVPHATLLRATKLSPHALAARVKPQAIEPLICWPADGFVLMESQPGESGSIYRVVWESKKNGGEMPPGLSPA